MMKLLGIKIYSALLIFFLFSPGASIAQSHIIENGQANAEIIIDDEPPRMVVLAALELQYYLESICSARLPVLISPGSSDLVRIYIGHSRYTDSLGIGRGAMNFGTFRMVSGENWLALLGDDYDYSPPESWARKHSDRPRALAEWDELTGELAERTWGHPFQSTFKGWWNPRDYDAFMSERFGEDNRDIWDPRGLNWSMEYQGPGAGSGFWLQDEGGSLNAVYAFLRSLGSRWYMPGQSGEVLPEKSSLVLPSVDTIIHPDFAVRSYTWYNYSGFSFDDIIWARRTGMNAPYHLLGNMGYAHGLTLVHSRSEMKMAHPEYYALIDGVRDTTHRGYGTVCFSSDGLVQEAVRFARFMFDHYNEPHVSMWPGDGYKQCQCDSCLGKSPSDLVWGFVDRVARELYSSHPDRIVSCGAYTPYIYPPEAISKFTPNLLVFIANAGRPGFNDTGMWDSYWDQVENWQQKVDTGRIMRTENNRYSISWGSYEDPVAFPVIHPHAMARDLQALKGISRGECCEESQAHTQWHAPGIDHLNLYVQARFLWDAGQDLDSLLKEYYRLFYGPAHEEMKAAFDFAESSYECYIDDPVRNRCKIADPREMDLDIRIHFLELLHTALDSAGNSIYGQRIRTILDELTPLDSIRPEKKETVTMIVTDRSNDEPIYRAEVRYGENLWATDYSGKAIIEGLDGGMWEYFVSHNAYFTLHDSLMIAGDTTLALSLIKKQADLCFTVNDESGPLAGVPVSLNGWKILSDAEGRVCFNNQPARYRYEYDVTHDGYIPVHDSLFLEIDTSLNILLQVATRTGSDRITDFQVFPNPSAGDLFIRIPSVEGRVLMVDPAGRVYLDKRLVKGLNVIDLGKPAPGIYLLKILSEDEINRRKLIIH